MPFMIQKTHDIFLFLLGQMQATITPCPPAVPSSQASSSDLLPKEGLVVMQVQQAIRETEGTGLDLSIKKPRLQQEYTHSLFQKNKHAASMLRIYRPEPGPYRPPVSHPEQGHGAKSPLIYASSPRPQAPITPKMNKVTVPPPHPKLSSPNLSNMGMPGHKGGSITHGTPVSTARYEGLLRQMTPPGNPTVTGTAPNANERSSGSAVNTAVPGTPKDTGGSITQGTPVLPFAVDKRGTPIYDYHTIRHSPVTGSGNVPPPPPPGPTSQTSSPAVVVSHGGNQYNSYTSGRPPPSYSMDPQLSSRQIIMNDYITSQQMHARSRGSSNTGTSVAAETTGKSEPPPPPSSTLYYTSTPPPSQTHTHTHTQPRQGVIQRHNTQKQIHYPPPPPGLEAFSSLVDVAVQQPSLPVPHPHGHPAASGSSGHEGLGKTMADRLLADRYDNNRAFREQEIRLQEHRIQEHRLAAAAVAAQHQRDRDRERDLVHLREKEEQHRVLHREKELQLERLAMQQQHQLEKDLQQQEFRQREEMHAETLRLSLPYLREKEMHQQMVAAAQREKEHEHRMAVQREKEIQQQEQRLAIQQHREKEHVEQAHRLAVQQAQRERDLAHLHQQQQKQQQIHQHIQQQRMEAERRLYRDQLYSRDQQQQQQQIDRDSSRLLSSGFSQSSRLQQSQQSQQQQQQSSSSSSRQIHSSNQPSEPTLTAASLIDAIITHQINQSVENASASGSSANQPARAGDRLFQVAEHIFFFSIVRFALF